MQQKATLEVQKMLIKERLVYTRVPSEQTINKSLFLFLANTLRKVDPEERVTKPSYKTGTRPSQALYLYFAKPGCRNIKMNNCGKLPIILRMVRYTCQRFENGPNLGCRTSCFINP